MASDIPLNLSTSLSCEGYSKSLILFEVLTNNIVYIGQHGYHMRSLSRLKCTCNMVRTTEKVTLTDKR